MYDPTRTERTISNVYEDMPAGVGEKNETVANRCCYPDCTFLAVKRADGLNLCEEHARLYRFLQKLEAIKERDWVLGSL
jgi:hypothetical protein